MNRQPLLLLRLECLSALLANAVVFPPAPGFGLFPLGFYETLVRYPVQHGIQHSFSPGEAAIREVANALDERIAVAFTLCEDREYHWPCACSAKFLCQHEGIVTST